ICSATERILKLRNYPRKQPYLLAALEDLQAHFGFLPDAAVAIAATRFGRVPDFDCELSTLFHFRPDNPHAARICTGPLCSKAGSSTLITALEATPDVAIEASHCLGICNQAPAAVLNGEVIPRASVEKILSQLNADNGSKRGARSPEA
ncbi:MAG: NAD(P)H-dependent oxidoreductase subunit E, partial [Mariprofundaceae bacterium]|nr:NAD(P)H-dependent oxidoreductase subunit E [Mariprofundaceae bacterium]